jgi:hypothetical protein
MPTFNLGDYGDETSDSDDEEAPPAAPVGRVRDNTPMLVQCTRAYQPAPAPAPAPAVKPSGANKHWTGAEDEQLAELVNKHGSDWEAIATELGGGRSDSLAKGHWYKLLQSTTSKQKRKGSSDKHWRGAEDEQLAELVDKHGSDWEKIVVELTSDHTPSSAWTHWVRQSKPTAGAPAKKQKRKKQKRNRRRARRRHHRRQKSPHHRGGSSCSSCSSCKSCRWGRRPSRRASGRHDDLCWGKRTHNRTARSVKWVRLF